MIGDGGGDKPPNTGQPPPNSKSTTTTATTNDGSNPGFTAPGGSKTAAASSAKNPAALPSSSGLNSFAARTRFLVQTKPVFTQVEVIDRKNDKNRTYLCKAKPPHGYKLFLKNKFPSCTLCNLLEHTIKGQSSYSLKLGFSSKMATCEADFKASEKITIEIGKTTVTYEALGTDKTDARGNYRSKYYKVLTFDNLPDYYVEPETLERLQKSLARYATFEKDSKVINMLEDGMFCGKATLSVEEIKLVPAQVVWVPELVLNDAGDDYEETGANVKIGIKCVGESHETPREGFKPTPCSYCQSTEHYRNSCPLLKARNKHLNDERKKNKKKVPTTFKCYTCNRFSNDCAPGKCAHFYSFTRGHFPDTAEIKAKAAADEKANREAKAKAKQEAKEAREAKRLANLMKTTENNNEVVDITQSTPGKLRTRAESLSRLNAIGNPGVSDRRSNKRSRNQTKHLEYNVGKALEAKHDGTSYYTNGVRYSALSVEEAGGDGTQEPKMKEHRSVPEPAIDKKGVNASPDDPMSQAL